MKKIIVIMIVSLVSNQLIAQTSAPTTGAKMLSTAESKKQNTNIETTINGIPYSQYKAQQDALKAKQKQAAPGKTPRFQAVTANPEELKEVSTPQKMAPTTSASKIVAVKEYTDKTSSTPVAKPVNIQQQPGS